MNEITAPWPEMLYDLPQREKAQWLLEQLHALNHHHMKNCDGYGRIVDGFFGRESLTSPDYAGLPFITVPLFKMQSLTSVSEEEVFKTLSSSGTSGVVSRVALDRATAKRQMQALTAIMKHWLGAGRRPMLIIDSQSELQDRNQLNARVTATMGFSLFGATHRYALDADFSLEEFLQSNKGKPLFIFGFTFMVWQWLKKLERRYDLSSAFLLHGGGWKKLQDQAVTTKEFNRVVGEKLGIAAVHNYYGMVEQVGSIFVACEKGYLHPPVFADVLVRDPRTLEVLPDGKAGGVQLLSAIPTSYPGHSLLSEDEGVVHGADDCGCGRKGKYFSIIGRLKRAELRGCSDTRRMA